MFNQILMALKFGAASEFALVKGIELARAHDAELHIFHALDFTLNELDEDDPKRVKMVEDAHQHYDAKIKPLLADFEKGLFICFRIQRVWQSFTINHKAVHYFIGISSF